MTQSYDRTMNAIPWIAAALTFAVHVVANPHYGYFRDELYFIMCGFHPAWGYVDQPPLVPLMSAATQLGGHSLMLLRAVPALFAAGTVVVAWALAAELGGGLFARVLTAIVVALCPVLVAFSGKVGTDEGAPFLWTLAAFAVLRVVHGADPRWWLIAGGALGLALETKYSAVFFAIALLVSLLVVPERRLLTSRWFLAGYSLGVLIALPSGLWQLSHGLPMLELLSNGQHGKNVVVGPFAYMLQQVLITGTLIALVWIAGLVYLIRRPQTRFLALTYVLLIVEMIALHGKHYYPGAVYPIPLAAGCVALELWTARARIVRPVLAFALALAGLVFVPLVLPILSEPSEIAYQERVMAALHVSQHTLATESHHVSALSSDFSDMHGWPELAATVDRVVATLTPAERERAIIVTSNYGEASAIAFFGHDLPPVASGHNQYYLWGTHGRSGDVLIDVNGDCGASRHLYSRTDLGARFSAPYVIPYEDNLPIMVCRGIRTPLATVWPTVKEYI